MKPLHLEMQAFGPYKNCCTVDFEAFEKGIFLITGDTGSGKSTIFDAMSFALFGEVSGGKDRKTTKTLRSDFASDDVETVVRYEFLYRGERYKIERNPEYTRKKKRGSGMSKTDANAEMVLPDGRILSGVVNVDRQVKELLGLDRERFSQIAMIAQGDFRKILTEKSVDRAELFRKVFDTSFYDEFQKRLADELSKAENEKKMCIDKTGELLNAVLTDEGDMYAEEIGKARECVYNPEFMIDVLEKSIEYCEAQIATTEKEMENSDNVLKKLHTEIATAKETNAAIERKAKLEGEVESLFGKKDEMREMSEKLKKAENAREVFVCEEKLLSARTKCEKTKKLAEAKEKELSVKSEEEKRAQAECEEAEKSADEIQKLTDKAGVISLILPDIKMLTEKRKDITEKEKQYIELRNNSIKSEKEYQDMRKIYFDNLAGVLANGLDEGEACPVCGSVHHPQKASFTGKEVKREELELAEKKAADTAKNAADAAGLIYKLKGEHDEAVKRIAQNTDADLTNPQKAYEDFELLLKKTRLEAAEKEENLRAARQKLQWAKNLVARLTGEKTALRENILACADEMEKCERDYAQKLTQKGFLTEQAYRESLAGENETKKMRDEIAEYEKALTQKRSALEETRRLTEGKSFADVSVLSRQETEQIILREKMKANRDSRRLKNDSNKRILKSLRAEKERSEALIENYVLMKELSDTANGKISGNKITFEAYIQRYYFAQIVDKANGRLHTMTGGRYFLETKDSGATRAKGGLDLEVFDRNTGKKRDVSTLSGGEGFLASLSLALGLSDMIQEKNGGIRLDMLFIDEGFGTLDETHLSRAVEILTSLSDNDRLVGIISHVSELKDKIDKKIVVKRLSDGSSTVTAVV